MNKTSQRWFQALGFAAIVGMAVGCDPTPDCESAAMFEPSVRIGVGEKAFEPLVDGDPVGLTWGNQGGSHIWIALETEGLNPGKKRAFGEDELGPDITFELLLDGLVVGSGFRFGLPLQGDAERAETVGNTLYFYGTDEYWDQGISAFEGRDLRIAVLVEDTCGTVVSEEIPVTMSGNSIE